MAEIKSDAPTTAAHPGRDPESGDRSTPEPPELFSDAYAAAWCAALNANADYRRMAADWQGKIVFEMQPDPAAGVDRPLRLVLELEAGSCLAARAAEAADLDDAGFAFSAPAGVWKRMLGEGFPPLYAVMTGRLKLVRGRLTALMPYTRAAEEMVATARRLPTRFPPGWAAPEAGTEPAL